MTLDQSLRDELERLLSESLATVSEKLSKQDQRDVSEYLDHGEYGVAYELLAFALDKLELQRPASLVEAGKKMGMVN